MRPQKITIGEMREMGVRGVLVYCADYRCSHSVTMDADAWPDDLVGIRKRVEWSPAELARRQELTRRWNVVEDRQKGDFGVTKFRGAERGIISTPPTQRNPI